MRPLRAAALAALAAGIALLVYAAGRGEVRFGFFLIIPYVYGTGLAAAGGMMLLMLAAFLGFASLASGAMPPRMGHGDPRMGYDDPRTRYDDARMGGAPGGHPPEARRKTSHGGVVLLGPIPIVWGSDRRVLPWMVGLGAALLLLTLFVTMAAR